MLLFRWIVGMPAAAMITAGLFFMMAEMIKNRHEGYPEPTPALKIKITAEQPPDGIEKPKPPRETLPEKLPETELEFPKSSRTPNGVRVDPAPVTIERTPPGGGSRFAGPSIRVTPTYPEGCRSKGAEGVVIVEFDVTPEGNVVNARITQSPDRCFDRPIRNAVAKWKYPPSGEAGRQAMRYGLVEVFNFQLVE
ncbi:TonB family protein [Hyphococcus sp.]|uniref:energy transducer TonB n=1 Tax=Hyphococcus sp. TaxID=2038636 RepID=UPI003CCBF01D